MGRGDREGSGPGFGPLETRDWQSISVEHTTLVLLQIGVEGGAPQLKFRRMSNKYHEMS